MWIKMVLFSCAFVAAYVGALYQRAGAPIVLQDEVCTNIAATQTQSINYAAS